MKDIQKIQEFFSKPLNEESTTFKVGDKVTYLGHPAEITKVNKEMTGAITYNVSYDKGNGKTKATNIYNKDGEIKSLNEAKTVELNDKQKKYLKSILNNRYGKGAELGFIDNGIEEFIQRVKLDLSKEDFQDLLNQDILKIRTKPDKKKPYKALFLSKDLTKMNLDENINSQEYFKPVFRKDKSYPDFLYVDIAYPAGSGFTTALGSKTMSGRDREEGAAKALSMGNNIAKKLESKYKIDSDDIEVKDLKNGKVQVFAVSDKFIKMASPSLEESKENLDDLHKKIEKHYGRKLEPSQISVLNGKDDEISNLLSKYRKLKKQMNEANGFKSGKEFISTKLQKYPKAVAKINQLIDMIGESNFTMEMAEWLFDFFNNAHFERPINEAKEKNKQYYKNVALLDKKGLAKKQFSDEDIQMAKKMLSQGQFKLDEAKEEDKVDTITMDVPLFIRMLEYSREDAAEDMDLHDVTEKAISLGKERGILQMDDYDEIIGTTKKVDEANVTWSTLHRDNANEKLLKLSKLSSAEYQKAKKLQGFKADNYKWNTDEDLYNKVTEASDYMKRRQAQDDYAINKKDKPAKSYNPNPTGKTDYMKRREKELAEVILAKLKK